MKTPEELAEEYMDQDKVICDAINHAAEHLVKAAFIAGCEAVQKEEQLKLAELYNHGSDVQKIASTYLKNKGIEGALLPYAENRFIDGYQAAKEHAHAALEEAEARIQELEDQVADGSKVMNDFDAMLEEKELVNIKQRDACYRSLNFLICNQSIPTFRLNDIRSYVGHLEDVLMARNSPEKPDGSNSSHNSDGWISVKDRLPETDDFCLVNTEFNRVRIAQYGWESWRFNDAYSSSEHSKSYVTHWMPLPKPPEE